MWNLSIYVRIKRDWNEEISHICAKTYFSLLSLIFSTTFIWRLISCFLTRTFIFFWSLNLVIFHIPNIINARTIVSLNYRCKLMYVLLWFNICHQNGLKLRFLCYCLNITKATKATRIIITTLPVITYSGSEIRYSWTGN